VHLLYQSADGVRQWQRVVLSRPGGATGAAVYGTPLPFSAWEVVIAVIYGDAGYAPEPVFLYSSTGGGTTGVCRAQLNRPELYRDSG